MKPSTPVFTVSDLDVLPLILTLKELATIYRLSVSTIRRQVQQGTFAPRPWDRYPYRWRREDIAADLRKVRPARPRKLHGFAAIGKPRVAKATLPAPPARASR